MTKKLSKLARSTRIENCSKLIKSRAPSITVDNSNKISAAAENAAFEVLVDTNSVHSYRQSIVTDLFEKLNDLQVPEYKQQYSCMAEFINPLEYESNDPKIVNLYPLSEEEVQFVNPP